MIKRHRAVRTHCTNATSLVWTLSYNYVQHNHGGGRHTRWTSLYYPKWPAGPVRTSLPSSLPAPHLRSCSSSQNALVPSRHACATGPLPLVFPLPWNHLLLHLIQLLVLSPYQRGPLTPVLRISILLTLEYFPALPYLYFLIAL